MEITYSVGGGPDWAVVSTLTGTLLGVLLGFGLNEFASTRRERQHAIRTARMLLHDLTVAVTASNLRMPPSSVPQRIETLHSPGFPAMLDLVQDEDDRTAITALCSGYEAHVASGSGVRTDSLIPLMDLVEAIALRADCHAWQISRKRRLDALIVTSRRTLYSTRETAGQPHPAPPIPSTAAQDQGQNPSASR